jgi:flagellar hook-associated protein 3 FlgL
MSMRVPTMSIYNSSKFELSRTLTDYNAAASTMTTGKRIQSPSDDPVGYAQVLDIDSTLSRLGQLKDNINTGLNWMTDTESVLNSVLDTISDAKQLGIAGNNGIFNDDDYQTAAAQVDELLEQLVDFANTSVNGHYLFSGTMTDTQPYAQPPVTYSGNDEAFAVSTGISSRVEVSYTGTEVFGDEVAGTDLFNLLITMRDDLATNSGGNLSSIIGDLDDHFENINNLISDAGIKTKRLETKEAVAIDFEITLTAQKSKIEDVDLTEAATDLALRETAYQAALKATSSIISMSLVDYIK